MNTDNPIPKPDMLNVTVSDGKYTVIQDGNGKLTALRYGEPWRSCVGDNLVLALACEVDRLRTEVKDERRLQMMKHDTATTFMNQVKKLQVEVGRLEAVPQWTQDLPTEQAEYWWWNGDEDSAPIHISIFSSSPGQECFAPMGQYGWTRAQGVSEMGGWWMPLPQPLPPSREYIDAARKRLATEQKEPK